MGGLVVALVLYGVFVVGLVDNYARPIVIDREAGLNPAVILVGVFGGTDAIGMTGLFIRPIVLPVFVTTVETFDDQYRSGGKTTAESGHSKANTDRETRTGSESESSPDVTGGGGEDRRESPDTG